MSTVKRAASRAGQVWQVARRGGVTGLRARAVRVAYRRWNAAALDFPLLPDDVADSTRIDVPIPDSRPERGRPLVIGWVSTPPSIGSGGHTTMFRMVQGLEEAGHTCVLYLYDRFGGDVGRSAEVIRRGWPGMRAEVRDIRAGIMPLDGIVATGWLTAHVIASRLATPARPFYFVQDYEPFFFARGSEYAFAADSYRFGFRCIAIGHMVADLLHSEAGVRADVAEFSCDTDVYRMQNRAARSGVVFYTKPDVPRRGYRLGALALAEFHRRHPEQPIHVFGDPVHDLGFPVVRHDNLSPDDLNALYNQTIAGLAMSFTNISLVAEEMLAAGTVPVVNDSVYARADMPHPRIRWAEPTPGAMADALCQLVENPDLTGQATAAAKDVRADNWGSARATVVSVIENEIYG